MSKLTIDGVEHEVDDSVGNLIVLISKERDELKDFAIWMTGCGYDFSRYKYFCEKRDELLK